MRAPHLALTIALAAAFAGCVDQPAPQKVPITTSSEEARRLFVEGRDLQEKVRRAEAREHFQQAIAEDDSFALAYLELASVSTSTKEFYESLQKAVAMANQVSRGEYYMILAFHAGVNGRPDEQFAHLSKLVELYPDDERARTDLGNWYFARQEWAAAIDQYERAVELDPTFAGPYNQMGYAFRYLDAYAKAEEAFKTYIELIPDEPNPYDSYAEFLMKTGRFEESIATYQKAIDLEPTFAPSYVGIGNDYIFLGRTDKARETFARLEGIAVNDGQRRTAHIWTAASYIHDGDTEAALAALARARAIADASGDAAAVASDLHTMGTVLLEAGRIEEARERFDESIAVVDTTPLPETVKGSVRRNRLFDLCRVQLAEGDLVGARATLDEYCARVEEHRMPSELRHCKHLEGLVAYHEGDAEGALAALEGASHHDPRVLYLIALANRMKGDIAAAQKACEEVANYNGIAFSYAFVRKDAEELLASLVPN
jgi:tetratricopeptide (TPR) repeat protein